MVLARLLKLFGDHSSSATAQDKSLQDGSLARKRIILNSLVDMEEEHQVTVLGSTGVTRGEAHVQNLKNGARMEMMPDGSSITRNEQGQIIKTCDALRCKREYAFDEETGDLLVKRFGMWSKPEKAHLEKDGTLFFSRGEVLIEERLNGLHIHTNKATGVSIQTHHHNNFELVKLANGEIWKRETQRDKELFVMWNKGKLTFKSETYFSPLRLSADTPSGPQQMLSVTRREQSWENGIITREKYTFTNHTSQQKDVNLAVHMGTGMLILKQVTEVLTLFKDGKPAETTFELKIPAKLRIDIPNKRCQLSDVIKVRSFDASPNIGIAFDTKDGHEYIVFSGTRGVNNRSRAGEAADMLEQMMDSGEMTADLVLR
ncbi:MAG TPA: hypothetical protein V6D22_19455 [Candidatus Obscuribacterales bacterium]